MNTFVVIFCSIFFISHVQGFGYTIPKGNINKLVNDTINIVCTIDLRNELTKGMNSSHLSFYSTKGIVPSEYVKTLNESSIELTITNAPEMAEIFTCELNKSGVSFNKVNVGYKPAKVLDFKCRSNNWQNLNCSFESQYNPVKPMYQLHFSLDQSAAKTIYYCSEFGGVLQQYWCLFDFDSPKGPYRQSYEWYYFELESKNDFGVFVEKFRINNYESVIPAAPLALKTFNTTSNSVYVQWNIPNELVTFPKTLIHRVKYMNLIDKQWKELDLIRGQQRSYIIPLTNLEYAYIWYDIRIDIKVDGAPDIPEMWSTFLSGTFRTKARRPDEPPQTNIGGFHVNDNGHIYIFWKSLPIHKYNGPNLHYNVTIDNGNFTNLKPNEITNTMAKYMQMPIKYQTDLIFNVFSVNEVGRSLDSNVIRVPTINNRLSAPDNLKKIRHNGSYNLSWTAPSFSDNVIGYTVFWCKPKDELSNLCEGSIDYFQLDGKSNTSFNYEYNFANVTLNFAVSANSKYSSSGMVWAECTALLNNDIGKLSESSISTPDIKPTFIEFKWNLGCVDRTILEGYILTYCPINDPKIQDCKEPEKQINIPGHKTKYTLTNLSPYTTYKTIISMRSAKRIGPPSESVLTTTMEAAPTPPRSLGYRDLTNNSVVLYWDPPKSINGVLMKYMLWYNEKSISIEKRDTSKMEYTLTNLTSYMDYKIVVLACTQYCSNSSNSISIKTEVGVPGDMIQPNITDSNGIVIEWQPPKIHSGKLQYYQLTVKMFYESGSPTTHTIQINGTSCTMQIKKCLNGIEKYDFSVQAVNIVHSPHRSIAKRYANANDDDSILRIKRHSSIENNSNQQLSTYHTTIPLINRTKELSFTDKSSEPILFAHNNIMICQEQDDIQLKKLFDSDKYAVHLHSKPSLSSFYYCGSSTLGELYVTIMVALFGITAISYVSFYVMKKFKKMKDIGISLPDGLGDLEDDQKRKTINLDCNVGGGGGGVDGNNSINNVGGKIDIGRSADDLFFLSNEQEESLLRNRMISGSSNSSTNTENNSNCEYNEGIDDSENEQQMDDDSTTNTNSDVNDVCQASPTPLLPISGGSFLSKDSPIMLSKSLHKVMSSPPPLTPPSNVIETQPQQTNILPALSSNNYVPAAMLYRPATSNGYVSHDAIVSRPPVNTGYVPWNAVNTKVNETTTSPDELKHAISGYVTQKQLSDFGQLLH